MKYVWAAMIAMFGINSAVAVDFSAEGPCSGICA
jgi:hypothetical protein